MAMVQRTMMMTTTIQEEMTNDDVDDVRPRPPHTTINLSDKEKGGLSDEEKVGGGYCGRDSSRAGR